MDEDTESLEEYLYSVTNDPVFVVYTLSVNSGNTITNAFHNLLSAICLSTN